MITRWNILYRWLYLNFSYSLVMDPRYSCFFLFWSCKRVRSKMSDTEITGAILNKTFFWKKFSCKIFLKLYVHVPFRKICTTICDRKYFVSWIDILTYANINIFLKKILSHRSTYNKYQYLRIASSPYWTYCRYT